MSNNIRHVLLVFLFTLLVSCNRNKVEPTKRDSIKISDTIENVQRDPLNSLEHPEAEIYYLKYFPNNVERIEDTLIVFLKSGKKRIFVNTDGNTDRERKYRYHGSIIGLPYIFITVDGYEEYSIIMLHDSLGFEHELDSRPYISPDSSHFVTLYNNYVGDAFYSIKVWRFELKNIVLEYDSTIYNSMSSDMFWITENKFRYNQQDDESGKLDSIQFSKYNGRWQYNN